MEQEKLPNVSIIIGLSIASILLCWCYGVVGLILSIIGIILAASSTKKYKENPEMYSNVNGLKTAKVLAIVSLIMNLIVIGLVIWLFSQLGWDVLQSGDQELIQERMEELLGQ